MRYAIYVESDTDPLCLCQNLDEAVDIVLNNDRSCDIWDLVKHRWVSGATALFAHLFKGLKEPEPKAKVDWGREGF